MTPTPTGQNSPNPTFSRSLEYLDEMVRFQGPCMRRRWVCWYGRGRAVSPPGGLYEPSPVMSRCLRGTGRRLGSGWFPAVGSFGERSLSIPMRRSAVSCDRHHLHPQANYDP